MLKNVGSETAVSTTQSPIRGEICSLIVTFNPDPSLEQNIRALLPQVDKIIIIDNHSADEACAMIRQLASATGVEVIWNAQNEGIAAALNTGIRRALAHKNYEWIATFDQDSRVSAGFMDEMIKAYQSCPFREKIALIGPRYIYDTKRAPKEKDQTTSGRLFKEIRTTMTSGNLVDPRALRVNGMFDESFFIDYVDHEFCFRLRRNGFRIIEAQSARILHRMGSPTRHRLLTRTVVTANYSATRRYYNSRNRLRVYRAYWIAEAAWVARDLYLWLKDIIKLILFEENRKEKLTSVLKGIQDAIQGKGGSPAIAMPAPKAEIKDAHNGS